VYEASRPFYLPLTHGPYFVYTPQSQGNLCSPLRLPTIPRRDVQAELTWVAGYIPR